VNWATLRRKQFLLAQGTGRITVLASTVGVLYIETAANVWEGRMRLSDDRGLEVGSDVIILK
jgi:hypothetical protein